MTSTTGNTAHTGNVNNVPLVFLWMLLLSVHCRLLDVARWYFPKNNRYKSLNIIFSLNRVIKLEQYEKQFPGAN